MGTYLNETRNLNLNLLEPKGYSLPWRRIFLRLPGNCKNFCLYNKQKHFVYIIKCGESSLPISHKTDDSDLQPLLGITGECGGDISCCPSHCWPRQPSVLLTGAGTAIYADCSATLVCSHIYLQTTVNFHLHWPPWELTPSHGVRQHPSCCLCYTDLVAACGGQLKAVVCR